MGAHVAVRWDRKVDRALQMPDPGQLATCEASGRGLDSPDQVLEGLVEGIGEDLFEMVSTQQMSLLDDAPQSFGLALSSVVLDVDKGYAYAAANGDVYYAVAKFEPYGRLSGKRLADLARRLED